MQVSRGGVGAQALTAAAAAAVGTVAGATAAAGVVGAAAAAAAGTVAVGVCAVAGVMLGVGVPCQGLREGQEAGQGGVDGPVVRLWHNCRAEQASGREPDTGTTDNRPAHTHAYTQRQERMGR